MKPKHEGGYSPLHAELCERTLVTLLRGLGPWKQGVYVVGGLVPRYLIPRSPNDETIQPHAGTTDVDLVLDLDVLVTIAAYRKLEQNLRALGFTRGTNDEGQPQHYSWRKPVDGGITIVVDLLCDASILEGGRAAKIPNERRLSALKVPGAHLAVEDHIDVTIEARLLDERGEAQEIIKVANIIPFIVLKVLAYEDRFEQKDAYDIIYCLMYYGEGPQDVATALVTALDRWPDEPLLLKAIGILRTRFASDERTPGRNKDGPHSYAQFLTNPGQRERDALNRQNAAAVVDALLRKLDALREETP